MMYYKLPFYILIWFNIFTIALYAIQPFILNNGNFVYTLLYLLSNILALYLGIKKGLSSHLFSTKNVKLYSFNPRLFNAVFFFYCLTFLIKYSYDLFCPLYDVNAIVNRIVVGLYDPKLGYSLKGIRQVPWTLYFFVSIIDNIFFVYGMLSWKDMKSLYKYIFVLLCVFEILFWFGKGTNFGVMIMISSVLFSFLVTNRNIGKIRFKRMILYGLGVSVLFFAAIAVFQHNMEARSGGDFNAVNTDLLAVTNGSVNYDSVLLKVLPPELTTLYLYIASYLTQGYYSLSYSFDCHFHWCYGLGNTPALMSFADLLGINVEPRIYQTQMYEMFQIEPYASWHSFYLWIANDVSLLGVPFVVFFIGRFVSTSFRLFKEKQDFLSGVVFIILANIILLFFANNNYLSSVFYSFMFIFPYWLFTRYSKVR